MRKLLLIPALMVLCASFGTRAAKAQDQDPVSGLRDDPTERRDAEPAADGSRTYTIVAGDWLSKISQRFYGTPYNWPLISEGRLTKGP